MTLGRFLAVWVLLLNGALAGALAAALVFGVRPVTVLDVLIIITLVVGLIGALSAELEKPSRDTMDVTSSSRPDEIGPKTSGLTVRFGAGGDQRPTPPRVVNPQGERPAAVDDLDAFLPERPQRHRL